jgi:filamentous hemagglutinin
LTKTLQLEEFIAPSTGKSIQAAVEGNAIVPIDKVSIYARGGVADVSEELRALQALKQSSRKEFDSNPANADRLDQLKSMQHNFDRSSEMGRQLENVGLTNTPANNNLLINHLLQTGQSVGPENRVWVPSLLEGPNGVLQVRSTWKIMSDDRAYLNTLMFVPIKK